jgi:O-antigen/teichoic acid export membrane protein
MPKIKIDHTLSFQIFQILKYGSSVIISIGLAKSYLSLSELGNFESFIFYSSTISFFWITGITQALIVLYPGSQLLVNTKNSYYFSCLLLITAFSIIFNLSFSILSNLSFSNLFSAGHFRLFVIYSLINPATFLVDYILLLEKRYKSLIFYGIITLFVPAALITLPAITKLDLSWCFYGLIIWSVIKLYYLIRLILKYSLIEIKKPEIAQFLKQSSPLIIASLITGSYAYIDSLIISIKFDSNTFAIFRYGAREFPLFLIVANSFGTSMIPLLSRKEKFESNLTMIKDKSRKMIYYSFPVALILLISSQFLFSWIFNVKLTQSYQVFDIYLLLVISRFVFPQSVLMGLRKNFTILKVSFAELMVNISASLILVYFIGYQGVAYGTVIAYYFEKTILTIILKRKYKIQATSYIAAKELIVASIILSSAFILKLCILEIL